MFFRQLFKHAHTDHGAGMDPREPALDLFHKRDVRDALPVRQRKPNTVFAARAAYLAHKVLRMQNAAQQRDVRAQIFNECFLRAAHDLLRLRLRDIAVLKPARIHEDRLLRAFDEHRRPPFHDSPFHFIPRFIRFRFPHCKHVFYRILRKRLFRLFHAAGAHAVAQDKIADLFRIRHAVEINKKRRGLSAHHKPSEDQIRVDVRPEHALEARLVFRK